MRMPSGFLLGLSTKRSGGGSRDGNIRLPVLSWNKFDTQWHWFPQRIRPSVSSSSSGNLNCHLGLSDCIFYWMTPETDQHVVRTACLCPEAKGQDICLALVGRNWKDEGEYVQYEEEQKHCHRRSPFALHSVNPAPGLGGPGTNTKCKWLPALSQWISLHLGHLKTLTDLGKCQAPGDHNDK